MSFDKLHKFLWTMLAATTVLYCGKAQSADGEAVIAHWEPVQVSLGYQGLEASYSCEALAERTVDILTALGAHSATRVTVDGCTGSAMVSDAVLNILTAVPIAGAAASTPDAERRRLLDELGLATAAISLPVRLRTIELSRRTRDKLIAVDCELVELIDRELLPKLSIEVVRHAARCASRIATKPRLIVRALLVEETNSPPP